MAQLVAATRTGFHFFKPLLLLLISLPACLPASQPIQIPYSERESEDCGQLLLIVWVYRRGA